jgi:hypothetical protein
MDSAALAGNSDRNRCSGMWNFDNTAESASYEIMWSVSSTYCRKQKQARQVNFSG